ncbi:MAG: VCBS repeat-containing protein [Alkalinema sp. RU_4_3]|nr:VCBS repeat-containing protein [Alkalinema sp. RU_4_3]
MSRLALYAHIIDPIIGQVIGSDGTDYLTGIESLKFSDRTVLLPSLLTQPISAASLIDTSAFMGLSNNFTVNDGGWASQNLYPRHLADVNGDGHADIVGFDQDNVYVSLGNTNGTFSDALVGLGSSVMG